MYQPKIFLYLLQFLGLVSCEKKVVCYFGSWSSSRSANGHFSIADIEANLCTHLIYAFVGITAHGDIRVIDQWKDLPKGEDSFNEFNALKDDNPGLKTLVAIGGASEGSLPFSQVMARENIRRKFVKNAVEFVKKHNFDGLDIDWEYPARLGGISEDKKNFVSLLEELRTPFDENGLLLSASVAAAEFAVDLSYNVPKISMHLDFINVMTYDFHGPYDGMTGQNAPLYARKASVFDIASGQDNSIEHQLNVNASIQHWLHAGAPREKLILGIAFYGRSYTLANDTDFGLGAPTLGRGNPGPYTEEPGIMGYNEICEKQMQGEWVFNWDDDQKVPYTNFENQWIGYDNIMSVTIKSRKAMEWDLGGVMAWSIDTDDFLGLCHKGKKFPLLTAINAIVNPIRTYKTSTRRLALRQHQDQQIVNN